ncbi:hypothetical protein ACIQU6_07540 [Streptomyces sp. NPDC090442]|uniref:hypothetical protein n=1 Tax=Streptomyces sp. NPDC090442 TaxID=3365962 RepID=UPI0038263DB3
MADLRFVGFQDDGEYPARVFRRLFGSLQDFAAGFDSVEDMKVTASGNVVRVAVGRAWVKDSDDPGGVFWAELGDVAETGVDAGRTSGYVILRIRDKSLGDDQNELRFDVADEPAVEGDRRLTLAKLTRVGGALAVEDVRFSSPGQYLLTRTGPAVPRDPTSEDARRFRRGTQFTNITNGIRWALTDSGEWVRDQGPKGDKGSTGSRGPKGDTGEIGPQGPAGSLEGGYDGVDLKGRVLVHDGTLQVDGNNIVGHSFDAFTVFSGDEYFALAKDDAGKMRAQVSDGLEFAGRTIFTGGNDFSATTRIKNIRVGTKSANLGSGTDGAISLADAASPPSGAVGDGAVVWAAGGDLWARNKAGEEYRLTGGPQLLAGSGPPPKAADSTDGQESISTLAGDA